MKHAAKNIWTLMDKEEQSVISFGRATLRDIITLAPCVILQLLNANLGVTAKVSHKPEISRYKGWLRNTGRHRPFKWNRWTEKKHVMKLEGHIKRMALPEYMDADVQGGTKRLFMPSIRCSSPVHPFHLAASSTVASIFRAANLYNEKSPVCGRLSR